MDRIDLILNKFVNSRLDHLGIDIVTNNPGYKEARENSDKLYNKLKATLTDEQIKLFDEFNEATNWESAIKEDLHYKLGDKDGYRIREFLDSDLSEFKGAAND